MTKQRKAEGLYDYDCSCGYYVESKHWRKKLLCPNCGVSSM